MGSLGRVFQADIDDDWATHDEGYIIALGDGKKVAEVELFETDDGRIIADIVVMDAFMLVRPSKWREFDPRDHGIRIRPDVNWRKEKIYPDIEAKIDVTDIPGIEIPKQPLVRDKVVTNLKLIGSMGYRE